MVLFRVHGVDKFVLIVGIHLTYGDEWFERREFHEALLEYNTAIRYAMPKSKESGILYYKRAAVYFECQKYAQSLENIQWARQSNLQESVIELMNELEEKCRSKMEEEAICEKFEDSTRLTESEVNSTDQKFDPWSFFKLSRPANEKIPFIINE